MKKYIRKYDRHHSEFNVSDIERLKKGLEPEEVDIDYYDIEFNPSHMVLTERKNSACITISTHHLNQLFGVTDLFDLSEKQREQLFDLIPNPEKYAETFIGQVDAEFLHRVKEDSET